VTPRARIRRRRPRAGCALALAAALLLAGAAGARAATDVEARLSAGSIESGGTVALLVTVTDPRGRVADPEFSLPPGLELLGSSRSQEFSWVNGRSTNVVTLRFEIGAARAGRYTVGPIRIQVGSQGYRSGELALRVSESRATSPGGVSGRGGARRGGSGSGAVASLELTLEPASPVVGQACLLRMRLIQRVNLLEDAQTAVPATPGFWSEAWGEAASYRARERGAEVGVVERALRLYPLAPGPALVSPAHALVTPASGGLLDPFSGLMDSRVEIRSESLRVAVRPLPAGAPSGFGGGVGEFEVAWRTDRSHTSQDQAITASLDIRGVGNLPLLRAPDYRPADFEVFAASVEDSLPAAGTLGPGRRTFLWTLLPRRAGRLQAPGPVLSWYDPRGARYVRQQPATVVVEVLSARAGTAGEAADGFPAALARHPSRPGTRAAFPPVALAGGLLVWLAFECRRRSRAPDPAAGDRARLREWLRSIGLVHGPDFWRAADDATEWFRRGGADISFLSDAIAQARFGGRTDREEEVRRRLVERLGAAMPPPPARWPWRAAATLSLVGAFALFVAALPAPGPAPLAERAEAADRRARAGEAGAAEAEWARLWDERPGEPALAARLAWGALQRDDLAAATVWALRGDAQEARDGALGPIARRVRDAGGLVGAPGRALPLRSWEWALLAFLCAAVAGAVRERRVLARALLALAVVAGLWWPAESAWRAGQRLAVVRASLPLPPGDVTLEPGQVVRVRSRTGGQVTVRAASDLEGTLPEAGFWFPGPR
jgi:hypothetical protein